MGKGEKMKIIEKIIFEWILELSLNKQKENLGISWTDLLLIKTVFREKKNMVKKWNAICQIFSLEIVGNMGIFNSVKFIVIYKQNFVYIMRKLSLEIKLHTLF